MFLKIFYEIFIYLFISGQHGTFIENKKHGIIKKRNTFTTFLCHNNDITIAEMLKITS